MSPCEDRTREVRLDGVLAALGGPEFRLTYPNGDQVAYVITVYAARIIGGKPAADGEETDAVSWVRPEELSTIGLGAFARAQFERLGPL